MTVSDVLIIGGGVTGCAAAYHLAREGHAVTLVERYAPAAMASGWTLAGVRQSARDPAELPLARAAVDIWSTLDEELDDVTGYRRKGNLRLARTEGEVEIIRDLVTEQQEAGLDLQFLESNDAIREIAPAVAPTVLAASFCPTDGHADPHATVAAFRRAAERHGAVFRLGENVRSIEVSRGAVRGVTTDRGRIGCDICVVAGGVRSNDLLGELSLDVPMRVMMTTIIQSDPIPPLLDQVLGAATANFAARQQIDGRMRVSGGSRRWHGAIEEGARPVVHPTFDAVAAAIEVGAAALPALRDLRISRFWTGLIDLTPDGLPVIEATPEVDGLIIACGFSGHGFGIAPVTGLVLRDLTLGEPPRLPLDAFRRARFADFPENGEWNSPLSLLG
ncbi:MAG: FAD-binding oxidoreductase [Thiotrichales bacterium]|nr:FAD-binding oxidoreductase [Thiotrichales bacterium]